MPTLTLLDDAMLRGGRAVPAINRLGGGAIAMTGSAQPWRVVGDQAAIYQLRQPNGRVVALRCLLSDTPEPALLDRYRLLGSDSLVKRLRAEPSSPIVGSVQLILDGISLPGNEFRADHHPLIAMDWVMGPTLIAATDRACRSRDQEYLLALAEAWRTAMTVLVSGSFVHGDLTADNAMVRPREGIALVDYDTAMWPRSGIASRAEQQIAYRHPRGTPAVAERRDDFAALVIFTSLRVLARWPELREEHGDPASQPGGSLLFSGKDLANPDGSALFGKIRVIDDPAVQALLGVLRETCRLDPDGAPPFLEAVDAAGNVARSIPLSRAKTALDARDRQQRLTRLNSLLLAGKEDEARTFWLTSGLANDSEAVRELGPRIADIERRRSARESTDNQHGLSVPQAQRPGTARERQQRSSGAHFVPDDPVARHRPELVERLRRALIEGDVGEVARIWPEAKIDPAASRYAAPANEIVARLLTAAIAGAIERGDDAGIVDALKEAERQGVAVGIAARQAFRAAELRLRREEELTRSLLADDRVALGAMALSGDLDEMGEFSPETTRQIVRALAMPHLERALALDDDMAIVHAFEPAVFADADALPPAVAHRVALAGDRVAWRGAVRAALKQRDAAGLREALSDVPPGAEERLSKVERKRATRMIRQADAIIGLNGALAEKSDHAIVDALNEFESAGATLPADLDWTAVRGVIDRLSLVASIRRAALADPPEYARLSRLLPQAREESAGEAPYLGANLDFAQLEEQVRRFAHRARLVDAIKRNDEKAIVAAASPDPYGVVATLSESERARVEKALSKQRERTKAMTTRSVGPGAG